MTKRAHLAQLVAAAIVVVALVGCEKNEMTEECRAWQGNYQFSRDTENTYLQSYYLASRPEGCDIP